MNVPVHWVELQSLERSTTMYLLRFSAQKRLGPQGWRGRAAKGLDEKLRAALRFTDGCQVLTARLEDGDECEG